MLPNGGFPTVTFKLVFLKVPSKLVYFLILVIITQTKARWGSSIT